MFFGGPRHARLNITVRSCFPSVARRARSIPGCAHVKTACEAVGISERTYYDWQARGNRARDEPPPSLEMSRQGLIDLLVEADVPHSTRATKTVRLRLLTLHREDSYLQFSHAVKRAGAIRTLESLARIELASQGGALLERVTTTRTSKTGVVTTTVRSGSRHRIGALTAGSSSGGIRLSGLGVPSWWCRVLPAVRLRRTSYRGRIRRPREPLRWRNRRRPRQTL